MDSRKRFLGETSSDLTNCLKTLQIFVPAGQQEWAEVACALALAMIGTHYNQVKWVSHFRVEVIFFQFQPVKGALGRFICSILV